jgi:hypothetical protein
VRRTALSLALAGLVVAGCGGGGDEVPVAPANTVDERCAQLSQEVVDAYNRGDQEAQKAAEDEFDRSCDK